MKKGDPVLVCTELKGVFFGYLKKSEGDVVLLTNVRNILYWPPNQRGFLGLTTEGPVSGSRVGPAASEVEIRKVSCISAVEGKAVHAWEGSPWS